MCSAMSVLSCKFISYTTGTLVRPVDLPSPFYGAAEADVGFFRYQLTREVYSQCEMYAFDEDEGAFDQDPNWMTARFSVFPAVSFIFIAFVFASIEFCCTQYFSSRFWISLFFLLATTAQGLTFLVLSTENLCNAGRECHLELGAYLSIAALCIYFTSGVLVCITPKPVPLCKQEDCCHCCKKKNSSKTEDDHDEEQGVLAGAAVVEEQAPEDSKDVEEQAPAEEPKDEETGDTDKVAATGQQIEPEERELTADDTVAEETQLKEADTVEENSIEEEESKQEEADETATAGDEPAIEPETSAEATPATTTKSAAEPATDPESQPGPAVELTAETEPEPTEPPPQSTVEAEPTMEPEGESEGEAEEGEEVELCVNDEKEEDTETKPSDEQLADPAKEGGAD